MQPLPTNLRRDLERAIVEARTAAERGARSALGALTVRESRPGAHLDAAGRALRNRLRAHARQLGDPRSSNTGEQAIDRLAREIAYEHWHRMLFARFLAENDLLIEPESGVSISLDDVEELAREQGVKPWPLAATCAQRMLPQIFRAGDPALAIDLPTETQLRLESLLEGLPSAVFTAGDSLGWTYQFWQSAEKDAVNNRVKSGEKITGETLPAVTQLFTEHYMVEFLLHNTIGAWWAGKKLTTEHTENAESEAELRRRVAPPGVDWSYLRFVRDAKDGEDLNKGTGPWRPAAGTYDGWPREAKSLRVLDPCCGSGHFLVAAFDLLVRLRIAEENLSTEAAIRSVLADNLFGLELDPRCTQIAAFNLAFAAWRLAGKPIDLPPLNIACSGIGPQSTRDEWLKMAEDAGAWEGIPKHAHHLIRSGLIDLHETFSKAPELGSLLDPSDRSTDLITADFETLKPFLDRVLDAEFDDDEAHERAVAARGMAAAAEILAGDYTLVVTNVPYLGRGSQSDGLRAFADANYKEAKADLATIFVARMLHWVGDGRNQTPMGTIAAVTTQNWLFLASYRSLRERLLDRRTWNAVARLGPGAFETIGGHVVNVALLSISGSRACDTHVMCGVDALDVPGASRKAERLRGDDADLKPALELQSHQRRRVDSVINFESLAAHPQLSELAYSYQGAFDVDRFRFRVYHWELPGRGGWNYHQSSPDGVTPFSGYAFLSANRDDGSDMQIMSAQLGGSEYLKGAPAWGKRGVSCSWMSDLPASLYVGCVFDGMTCAVVPDDEQHLPALWAFCSSALFNEEVRKINQKMQVANATLVKVPFDLDHWQRVAAKKYPNGLPEPQSDDPTQWLFHGHPAGRVAAASSRGLDEQRQDAAATLQVGVARLLGYRWPAELDEDMRLAPEARELVRRCAELADHADEDGIVCLTPLRGEASASDRLRRLLAAAFGSDWSNATERDLLAAAAEFHKDKKTATTLEEWLRDSFFEQHCKLFHHRPFVWHIWDGRKDGFHALVNYHKLAGLGGQGRKTLESVTYSYLGDWIRRQEAEMKSGAAGSEARLAAAMELKEQLEKILAGEPPCDIFVRWKPLHEQPIGWAPDINDGVRLNIRPFLSATLTKGKKGAGALRWKPNIKWTKDRGKEPQKLRPREDFPWFWSWDEKTRDFTGGSKFDGNRWNDLHYTNDAKQAARERAVEEAST